MALLELFLCFVLHFEGISGETHHFYHRPGNDVILPCSITADECSTIHWTYYKYSTYIVAVVRKGHVVKSSDELSRLSVHTDCSLGIKNITAEDAGLYSCLYAPNSHPGISSAVYLNILTLSASPSHTDSERDGDTLECSLFRYSNFPACDKNTFRWVDETGTVLLHSKFSDNDPLKCASRLTMNPPSGPNTQRDTPATKRYTCQFVQESSVKMEAHYPPVLTDSSNTAFIIIIGAVIAVLLLVVIAAVFIKYRRRPTVTEDVDKPSQCYVEPESSITYATIDHADKKASPKKKVMKEDVVTYSAVKMKAGSDPSSIYSSVS